MKVEVIYGEPQDLAAALREWLSQHPRAQVQAAQPTSATDSSGKVIVTVVIWYRE